MSGVESCRRWTDLNCCGWTPVTKVWLSLDDIVTLTLSCPGTTLLRERRLQDESFEISFQAAFSDTSSADSFSSELTDASTPSDLGSLFRVLGE